MYKQPPVDVITPSISLRAGLKMTIPDSWRFRVHKVKAVVKGIIYLLKKVNFQVTSCSEGHGWLLSGKTARA